MTGPVAAAAPVRLLPARSGWWALNGTRVALLPPEAVRDGRLVTEAERLLTEGRFFDPGEPAPYAVTVLTATACNLGCSYCFQNTGAPPAGSSAPPRIAPASLTPDAVARIVAFVRRRADALGHRTWSLLLFGGEPLLNPAACLGLLRGLAGPRLARAQMTSNAVLLTPPLAVALAEAGLSQVQVTFDGARPVHDRIRVTRNGRGTYDAILTNLVAAAAATALHLHLRVNVSHHNLAGLDELVDELTAALPPERTSINLALVDDVGIGYANEARFSTRVADAFVEAYRTAIGRGVMPSLSADLAHCPVCAQVGGTTGAVVNADGRLYSCWETAGRPDWAVGDIDSGYLPPDELRPRWVACDYDVRAHGSPQEGRAFADRVDGAVLDELRDRLRAGVPLPVVPIG